MDRSFQVINFYEFKPLGDVENLRRLKTRLRELLIEHSVFGTIIIATEGFNASLCTEPERVNGFIAAAEFVLDTKIDPKSSFSGRSPFRRQEVKIKPEIVTLKRPVDISLGEGTHVDPKQWNDVIADPEVLVLDARNDYEVRSGTFPKAVNPNTVKFSDLPLFVAETLDPQVHKKVAMFCTGGIRCEKFAPYLKAQGFADIFQLRGGILRYLEEVPVEEQVWEGECFVFDERVTLDRALKPGSGIDLSLRRQKDTE